MKRFFGIITFLVLCSTCFGISTERSSGRYGSGKYLVAPSTNSNTLMIGPKDDLATSYSWLASSDRDGKMGALSATNRRTLILSPGTYSMTSTLELDANFVDICGLSGDPAAAVLKKTTAKPAITQTATDARLSYFKILGFNNSAMSPTNGGDVNGVGLLITNNTRGTGASVSTTTITKTGIGNNVTGLLSSPIYRGDDIFLWGGGATVGWYKINSVTSADTIVIASSAGSGTNVNYSICAQASVYDHMIFSNSRIEDTVFSVDAVNGYATTLAQGHMGGLWLFCKSTGAGYRIENPTNFAAVYTDNAAAVDKGTTPPTVGIPVTGHNLAAGMTFTTITGSTGYNLWRAEIISTTANEIVIRAPYNAETFDATDSFQVLISEMRPDMYYCTAGNFSYGGDTAGMVAGTYDHCTAGHSSFGGCGAAGSPINGTFLDCTAGNTSFALKTWIGSSARLERCTAGNNCFAGGGTSGNYPTYIKSGAILIDCKADYSVITKSFGQGTGSLSGVEGIIINCRLGSLSDYAGGASRSTPMTIFTGTIRGCQPWVPVSKASAYTLNQFENGITITNSGASGDKKYTLPPATIGLEYTFVDIVDTAAADVNVAPNGTDVIIKTDLTAMAAGETYNSQADAYAEINMVCRRSGYWNVIRTIGTWVEASP